MVGKINKIHKIRNLGNSLKTTNGVKKSWRKSEPISVSLKTFSLPPP